MGVARMSTMEVGESKRHHHGVGAFRPNRPMAMRVMASPFKRHCAAQCIQAGSPIDDIIE